MTYNYSYWWYSYPLFSEKYCIKILNVWRVVCWDVLHFALAVASDFAGWKHILATLIGCQPAARDLMATSLFLDRLMVTLIEISEKLAVYVSYLIKLTRGDWNGFCLRLTAFWVGKCHAVIRCSSIAVHKPVLLCTAHCVL